MAERWSQEQETYIRRAAGDLPAGTIATIMGRSKSAIQSYARKHGISLAVERKRWTQQEDDKLARMVADGKKPAEIAYEMGRTDKAISNRISVLRGRECG